MEGVLLACEVENLSTRADGSIKIVLGTNEMSAGKMAELFALRKKIAGVYISAKETISDKDLKQVDAIDIDMPGKTPSQRLRAVLYRNWEQNPEGHKDFQYFYINKMESYITALKDNLV